jgi:hypothetical protein
MTLTFFKEGTFQEKEEYLKYLNSYEDFENSVKNLKKDCRKIREKIRTKGFLTFQQCLTCHQELMKLDYRKKFIIKINSIEILCENLKIEYNGADEYVLEFTKYFNSLLLNDYKLAMMNYFDFNEDINYA